MRATTRGIPARRWGWSPGAGAALAALVVAVTGCSSGTMELSDSKLRKAMLSHTIPEREIVLPFAVDGEIRSFARGLPRAGAPLERGRAVAQAVRKLVDDGKATRWRYLRLPEVPPRTAGELLRALKAGSAGDVHSYEVAALTLATARAAGLHALMAEVHRQGGKVADPSGYVGAYAVAIFDKVPAPNVVYVGYVDAFGDGAVDLADVQDDPTAAAGFYVLKSLAHSGGDGDIDAATRASQLAARLAPKSPLPHGAMGQAMLAAGQPAEALAELRLAVLARDDAPRHVNMANGFLAVREIAAAEDGMRMAIERDQSFTRAHASLAVVLVMKPDEQGAAFALSAAERIDPKAPGVGLARAQLMAAKNDVAGAERALREELALDPRNELTMMMLYGVLRMQQRDADADQLRDEMLRHSKHEARLRQLLDAAAGGGS